MKTIETEIFYNVLMFKITSNEVYKIIALELIKELAKKYHITILKREPTNLKLDEILKQFHLNSDGYSEMKLTKLYYVVFNLK